MVAQIYRIAFRKATVHKMKPIQWVVLALK